MAASNPWPAEFDQQLRDLHGQGLSLRECATRLGRSRGCVGNHAKDLGLSWDRAQTKAATSARVADNRALRSQLEAGFLADAAKLRAQLFSACTVFNFGGKDNTYEERVVDKPPFVDQLKIMQAATIAVTHSLKIAIHDGDPGTADAIGMLDAIAGEIRAAAGTP
jgi:hypothetical protein